MARGEQARARRVGLIVALSLLAHGVVLSVVGFSTPKLVVQPLPALPVDIWLAPPLARRPHRLAERRAAASSAAAPLTSKAVQPRAAPSPPTAQPPLVTASPPGDAKGLMGPGPEIGQGVQQALRSSIGCDLGASAHLTSEERDRCNQHVGETAKLGPKFIDTIPPEKRAYYDAVQAAYQAMNDPRTPVPIDDHNNYYGFGHLPALGCGLKFGGKATKPDHSSFTDKIKATGMVALPIGPLRCGVVLPKGSWTPELGIPTP